jgi:hypothetical protein
MVAHMLAAVDITPGRRRKRLPAAGGDKLGH